MSYRLETPNNPSSKKSLSLIFIQRFVPWHISWDECPVLVRIVFKEEHILLKLAEYHEGTFLRERGSHALHIIDRVTGKSQDKNTRFDDTLTWLRMDNFPKHTSKEGKQRSGGSVLRRRLRYTISPSKMLGFSGTDTAIIRTQLCDGVLEDDGSDVIHCLFARLFR
jgi:hypothetical protein